MSPRKTFLPFSPPFLTGAEIDEVVDTLRSDWITTGPKTKRFEKEFAQFIGAPAALAVNSCTDAMLVALAASGIGPGDEVITTPMTFCSTAHVIEHLGARPVFVDVERRTLNIDAAQVERAVTGRTRALMPVHLYGHPCDMGPLLDIAEGHNLTIVEDAAHAFPAKWKGRFVGTLGDFTAFSFYATKNLTTGEGGMLTGSEEWIDRARPWVLHGMSRDAYKRYGAGGSWFYKVSLPGFKCNMTDIQAALGLAQLKRISELQARRSEIVQRYNYAFSKLSQVEIPVCDPEVENANHLYVLRLNSGHPAVDRDQFIAALAQANIGASVHFIPVHMHDYYREKYGYKPDDFPVAWSEYQRIVSLPLYPRMSDEDVDDVIASVTDIAVSSRAKVFGS